MARDIQLYLHKGCRGVPAVAGHTSSSAESLQTVPEISSGKAEKVHHTDLQ